MHLGGCGRVAHFVVAAYGGGGEPVEAFGQARGLELTEGGFVTLLERYGGVLEIGVVFLAG